MPHFSLLNILKIDGSRCVGKQDMFVLVVEHFNGVFNESRKFDLSVTDDLPKIAFVEFDSFPSRQEFDVGFTQMSIGAAPGIDKICIEALNVLDLGHETLVHLFQILQILWVKEDIQKQWIDAILEL